MASLPRIVFSDDETEDESSQGNGNALSSTIRENVEDSQISVSEVNQSQVEDRLPFCPMMKEQNQNLKDIKKEQEKIVKLLKSGINATNLINAKKSYNIVKVRLVSVKANIEPSSSFSQNGDKRARQYLFKIYTKIVMIHKMLAEKITAIEKRFTTSQKKNTGSSRSRSQSDLTTSSTSYVERRKSTNIVDSQQSISMLNKSQMKTEKAVPKTLTPTVHPISNNFSINTLPEMKTTNLSYQPITRLSPLQEASQQSTKDLIKNLTQTINTSSSETFQGANIQRVKANAIGLTKTLVQTEDNLSAPKTDVSQISSITNPQFVYINQSQDIGNNLKSQTERTRESHTKPKIISTKEILSESHVADINRKNYQPRLGSTNTLLVEANIQQTSSQFIEPNRNRTITSSSAFLKDSQILSSKHGINLSKEVLLSAIRKQEGCASLITTQVTKKVEGRGSLSTAQIKKKVDDRGLLARMIESGLMKPASNCLTIMFKGVHVHANLLADGSIQDSEGCVFKTPEDWIFSVRKVKFNVKTAWRMVKYLGKPVTNLVAMLRHHSRISPKISQQITPTTSAKLVPPFNDPMGTTPYRPVAVSPKQVLLSQNQIESLKSKMNINKDIPVSSNVIIDTKSHLSKQNLTSTTNKNRDTNYPAISNFQSANNYLKNTTMKTTLDEARYVILFSENEFISSNKFLPKNFWDVDGFQELTIDDDFLKSVDFY